MTATLFGYNTREHNNDCRRVITQSTQHKT